MKLYCTVLLSIVFFLLAMLIDKKNGDFLPGLKQLLPTSYFGHQVDPKVLIIREGLRGALALSFLYTAVSTFFVEIVTGTPRTKYLHM